MRPAFHDDQIDLDYLLGSCPNLAAAYNETLRVTASSSSVRTVVHPTELHGKTLSPGKVVLIPYRQLHCNADAFGSDFSQFRPERFLLDKDLSRNPNFKPFGCGTTICPGRFLAQREVVAFVAFLLHRFELSLAQSKEAESDSAEHPPFPKIEDMKPCLGIMGPARGEDVMLFVRPATLA